MDDEVERSKEREINAVTFSFNVPRLKEDVAFGGDTVATVIRAHLYVEHVILQTLAEAFEVPDVVDFRRMSFLAKLDLCVGLGIYPRPWREIITRVNDMRNRVAHKLDAQVTEHAKRELWELLPEIAKQSLYSKYEDRADPLLPIPLARIFHGIIVWTDIFRQTARRQRIEMKYASLSAVRVIHPLHDEEAVQTEASMKALELIHPPGTSGKEEPGQLSQVVISTVDSDAEIAPVEGNDRGDA